MDGQFGSAQRNTSELRRRILSSQGAAAVDVALSCPGSVTRNATLSVAPLSAVDLDPRVEGSSELDLIEVFHRNEWRGASLIWHTQVSFVPSAEALTGLLAPLGPAPQSLSSRRRVRAPSAA